MFLSLFTSKYYKYIITCKYSFYLFTFCRKKITFRAISTPSLISKFPKRINERLQKLSSDLEKKNKKKKKRKKITLSWGGNTHYYELKTMRVIFKNRALCKKNWIKASRRLPWQKIPMWFFRGSGFTEKAERREATTVLNGAELSQIANPSPKSGIYTSPRVCGQG